MDIRRPLRLEKIALGTMSAIAATHCEPGANFRFGSKAVILGQAKRMSAAWRALRETGAMDQDEFADFYGIYAATCIRAEVEPLTPEAVQQRLAEWRRFAGRCRGM